MIDASARDEKMDRLLQGFEVMMKKFAANSVDMSSAGCSVAEEVRSNLHSPDAAWNHCRGIADLAMCLHLPLDAQMLLMPCMLLIAQCLLKKVLVDQLIVDNCWINL